MSKKVAPVIHNKAGKKVSVSAEHWYFIQDNAEAAQPVIEVFVYGEIGTWGITANQFVQDLRAVDDGVSPVVVAFNSIGGDLFDGLAIHNALARLGERGTGRVDALAASAASVAVCGAHRVVMSANSIMMIHNPWTYASGDADGFRKIADVLDQTLDAIVASYKAKAPDIDEAELRQLIAAETWLTAAEALALGLADEVSGGIEVRACIGEGTAMKRYQNAPDALKALLAEGSDPPEVEPTDLPVDPPAADPAAPTALALMITQRCTEAGIANLIEPIISATKLESETIVLAALASAKAVRDLCVAARLPELTGEYVAAGLDATAVRARLFDKVVGKGGSFEINNSLPLENDPPAKVQARQPDSQEIYAARKAAQSGKPQSSTGARK